MQLEDKARVIVDAAAERGRKFDRTHVDAARDEKSGPGLEQVECRSECPAERDLGVGRKLAQFTCRLVGIALQRQEALDQRAGLARQPRRCIDRRLLEETIGDLGDRTAADGSNAGDREEVGDEMMRGFGVGAGQSRKHALIFLRAVGGRERQFIEIVRQRGFAVEIFFQPPPPYRREIERIDEGAEQSDVAHANFRRVDAILLGRFEAEREHFGVGCRHILPAEAFDADLQEFGRSPFAVAKHRAEIAEARGLAGCGRGQIGARHRDRQIGPQAQFAAVRIGGEKHAAADVLAAEIEKRLGRLQHRRLDPQIGIVGAARIGSD